MRFGLVFAMMPGGRRYARRCYPGFVAVRIRVKLDMSDDADHNSHFSRSHPQIQVSAHHASQKTHFHKLSPTSSHSPGISHTEPYARPTSTHLPLRPKYTTETQHTAGDTNTQRHCTAVTKRPYRNHQEPCRDHRAPAVYGNAPALFS